MGADLKLYVPNFILETIEEGAGIDAANSTLYLMTTQNRFRLGESAATPVLSFATDAFSIETQNSQTPSSILSSQNSLISGTIKNTVVLGGDGITATQSNTAYVDKLNIKTLETGTTISNLGIDSNGFVVSGVNDTDTIVTGFTYSNNNFTISQDGGQSDLVVNVSTMTGLTINGDLNVNGQTIMSASGQSILTIIGSGDTSPLFTIQGSSGELFSVTDSLVGSLFSVNDISGLPILEVFDDDTVHIGSYQAPSLNTTVLLNLGTGLSTVYSLPLSAYTGAWFEYTISNTIGARAGQIMSIFSGSSINFIETTTADFGSTTPITFTMSSDGSNASLQVSAATTGWEMKTIVRSI